MIIERDIEPTLRKAASGFPVVLLTGPRQSGKSTIIRHVFADYRSVSLEDVDTRQWAKEDPRGFLRENGDHLFIDEVQYAPELFSYMQTIVDSKDEPGMFILSGSQNFSMMKNVTQSLAGRVGILSLLPLSLRELARAADQTKLAISNDTLNDVIFLGGYPRLFRSDIDPVLFYSSYFTTYLERDVRAENAIGDLVRFTNFMRVCAARVGEQVNWADLARVADIDERTAKSWMNVLGACFIVRPLQPYCRNFDKRITKAPRLYFYDTGLACNLLGIRAPVDLNLHTSYGHLFENLIVNEYLKGTLNFGLPPNCYYWRENDTYEVDLLVEDGPKLHGYEIKASWTARDKFVRGLARFATVSETSRDDLKVIYTGDTKTRINGFEFLPFAMLDGKWVIPPDGCDQAVELVDASVDGGPV
ncbi:MAG: ATP-binding protein [Propionibacteriaceae bacterium]|jgi:predicted AAA+ superfamily ATPase|nr:ATP-binding protein [Propionibacteriaceae bacterium]